MKQKKTLFIVKLAQAIIKLSQAIINP